MFSRKALEDLAASVAVAVLLTLGAAVVNLGPTDDLTTWGRNLLFAMSSSAGAALVNWLRKQAPADDAAPDQPE
jgi:hypothetical protein